MSQPDTPLSPSHPRFLDQPSPPPTRQVLGDAANNLRAIEAIQNVTPNWPELGEVPQEPDPEVLEEHEVRLDVVGGGDGGDVCAVGRESEIMADYDQENKDDGDKAQDLARSIKVEFEPNDIVFWFSQLEGEMLLASVNSQWLKKTILQRNLPNKQKEDVKAYLSLSKTEAGNAIYYNIKKELIRIYAPKPGDAYRKALQRQLVGLPSQLGYQIVNDVCKKASKLNGCCCEGAVLAIWTMKLPSNIYAHICDRAFNKDTYKSVFEDADKVFLSNKSVNVAAIAATANSGDNLDETVSAFTPQNQPQVAAMGRGRGGGANRGGGRGNRGNRGGNRGGQRGGGQGGSQGGNQGGSQQQNGGGGNRGQGRGPRHSSNPPESVCDRHYRHGPEAWWCVKPLTCPWKDKVVAQ